nr:MAG TPA: hypothetical protein [Caudoviricetes sp.]
MNPSLDMSSRKLKFRIFTIFPLFSPKTFNIKKSFPRFFIREFSFKYCLL